MLREHLEKEICKQKIAVQRDGRSLQKVQKSHTERSPLLLSVVIIIIIIIFIINLPFLGERWKCFYKSISVFLQRHGKISILMVIFINGNRFNFNILNDLFLWQSIFLEF